MPLDAFFLSENAAELSSLLPGCRVDKIQQPERDLLIFHLRGTSGAVRLLLSAGNGTARMHLTTQEHENPAEPPMFCMLLRKHLSGARILSLEQPDWERVYLLTFGCLDELGEPSEKKLALEMLGKGANLVLIDGKGRVLDCLRKSDPMSNPKRPMLPGLFYELPPKQEKLNLFLISEELFQTALSGAGVQSTDEWLVQSFAGVSPLLAREIAARAGSERLNDTSAEALWQAFLALRGEESTPLLLKEGDRPRELYCRRLRQYGGALKQEILPDYSMLLDAYYSERERIAHQQQRSQSLTKLVKTRCERCARKLAARIEERKATLDRETWRQYGDIIKANLYRMERGAARLEAENFYDPESRLISIPLEPKLSPQKNAERYYKLYTKAKNAEKILTEQIEEARRELEYLQSVEQELQLSSGEKELSEIRRELTEQGYIRESGKKRRKEPPPRPQRYLSPSGAEIRVGRNNLQNDQLTLHSAEKTDLWFHVQKAHGSHVVARCTGEDRETVYAAAMLAAWYSEARDSSNVAVDFTQVRYVKKPAGAKPGMVIYTDQQTLFITPDRGYIESLQAVK